MTNLICMITVCNNNCADTNDNSIVTKAFRFILRTFLLYNNYLVVQYIFLNNNNKDNNDEIFFFLDFDTGHNRRFEV